MPKEMMDKKIAWIESDLRILRALIATEKDSDKLAFMMDQQADLVAALEDINETKKEKE